MQPRTAVVVQKGDHSLGFYELGSGREVARVPVDRYPHEMALSRDRTLALVTHFGVALAEDDGDGGNTVSVVDLVQRERVAVIDCGRYRRPHGIAMDASDRAYVLSEGTSTLMVIDDPKVGRVSAVTPTGGDGSHMVSVSRDGRFAFCSNMRSGTITIVEVARSGGGCISIPVGRRPEGSVLDADESTLYVANRESGDVAVVDTRQRTLRGRIRVGAGPVRLCWDERGLLLVALYHARALAVVDPEMAVVVDRMALPGAPISIAFDAVSRTAYLSTLEQQVVVVDMATLLVTDRIATRADPDPVAVIA